jgi:hypothetical protein
LLTFTIITTDPNEVVHPMRDRMPVIAPERDYDQWLKAHPDHSPIDLLRPYDADEGTQPQPRSSRHTEKRAEPLPPGLPQRVLIMNVTVEILRQYIDYQILVTFINIDNLNPYLYCYDHSGPFRNDGEERGHDSVNLPMPPGKR